MNVEAPTIVYRVSPRFDLDYFRATVCHYEIIEGGLQLRGIGTWSRLLTQEERQIYSTDTLAREYIIVAEVLEALRDFFQDNEVQIDTTDSFW